MYQYVRCPVKETGYSNSSMTKNFYDYKFVDPNLLYALRADVG
jgi:hypothetical protein